MTMRRIAILIMLFLILPVAARAQVVYVYVTPCESCARVSEFLDGFADDVEIERVDYMEELARVQLLFDEHGVPDDKRFAPAVFAAGECLIGAEQIESRLPALLVAPADITKGARDALFACLALALFALYLLYLH
jgi:hypothetical protein